MTNYPQQPEFNAARGPQGMGESPLTDPSVRMILSMSPQDGSLRPLPADLQIQESADGTMNVTYPDGSIRQLIPGAEGEGRMITTLADGTRIQSDLTFGEGQVSVSSISSTGEKTLLSLNENGANMQRVTADGQVFSFIPDSAPELIESFREAEAFAQEQDFQRQEDFQSNQQYGEWNNYGKPADWQPEQNWQPPQGDFMQPPMQPQNFGPQFGGPEFGGPQPMPFAPMQPQHFGGNDFGRPDYAGNNWVDNGNGSWIAPVQPNAFQFPAIETQVPAPYSMGQSNINVVPGVESTNWQPPQGNYMQPQNLGPQYGGPQGIIDTNGYPQATPVIANGSWGTSAGHYDMKDFMQPPQPSDASGFFKPNPTDGSGFPFAPEANAPSFDGSSPIVEIVTSFDEAPNDEWNNPEQAPQQ